MARSPLVMAALLSAAMPATDPVSARPGPGSDTGEGVDVALVTDRLGAVWEVRCPTASAAGAALEREAAVLAVLAPLGRPLDGGADPLRAAPALPFAVSGVAASTPLPEGGRALVLPRPPGEPLSLAALTGLGRGGRAVATSLGRALAAVHELPGRLLEDAGAPVHTAADYRERRLAALDRAAATGLVPSVLLERWERGLEDVGRWRFAPSVVHGDLSEDDVLVEGGEHPGVSAVVRWGGARVADPADDLAWLAAGADDEVLDVVLEAYAGARTSPLDPHLLERARLVSELALTDWLLHGVRSGDQDVVDDAHAMLRDLEATTPAPGA